MSLSFITPFSPSIRPLPLASRYNAVSPVFQNSPLRVPCPLPAPAPLLLLLDGQTLPKSYLYLYFKSPQNTPSQGDQLLPIIDSQFLAPLAPPGFLNPVGHLFLKTLSSPGSQDTALSCFSFCFTGCFFCVLCWLLFIFLTPNH